MRNRSMEVPQKSLQIKEDDRFFSRLLSKEKSMANSSFRVYYGGAAGAVPFMWESQPGTPKHKLAETSIPPLTPPPSFHSLSSKRSVKKSSKSKLLHAILPKLSLKKTQPSSPPPPSPSPPSSLSWSSSLSSSSSSSLSSNPTTPSNLRRTHRRIKTSRLSFDSKGDDEYQDFGYSTPTFCFGMGRESCATPLNGCNSMMVMKNAFLSIVGHRSDRGTTV